MTDEAREKARQDSGLIRQWRVTLTEHTSDSDLDVSLCWRTFPCRADEWDGMMSAVVRSGPRPVTSQDALRSVLLAAAKEPWSENKVVGRRSRRRPLEGTTGGQ